MRIFSEGLGEFEKAQKYYDSHEFLVDTLIEGPAYACYRRNGRVEHSTFYKGDKSRHDYMVYMARKGVSPELLIKYPEDYQEYLAVFNQVHAKDLQHKITDEGM